MELTFWYSWGRVDALAGEPRMPQGPVPNQFYKEYERGYDNTTADEQLTSNYRDIVQSMGGYNSEGEDLAATRLRVATGEAL
jgi:hypothetical protein